MPIRYFAYGSNMLHSRLRERVPSAKALGTAALPGHALRFEKLGKDGSAKANIARTGAPGDVVYGVLYELDEAERPRLDRAEGRGRGYDLVEVPVRTPAGEQMALTYAAAEDAVRPELKPSAWYKDLVVRGAEQNRLPRDYIGRIAAVEAIEGPPAGPSKADGRGR